ncbi:MAG: AAA family ATPase [Pseudomonadota bacterium]
MLPAETLIEKLDQYHDEGVRYLSAFAQQAEQVAPRRFKGAEVLDFLGIRYLQQIYHAEQQGYLPAPDRGANNQRLGYTLEQLLIMRQTLGLTPWFQANKAAVISFTNFKGGCWKSTSAWHAATYYANRGCRVLIVDLDPQATLSKNVGLQPDLKLGFDDTLGNALLSGEEIHPEEVRRLIKSTYLPNMDVIGSCLELAGVEFALVNALMRARTQNLDDDAVRCFFRVKLALEAVTSDYDVVVLDGTPSLGLLPLNIVFGSDHVITPTPTEIVDYSSTLAFCAMLSEQLGILSHYFGSDFAVPHIAFMPTRFNPSEKSATRGSQVALSLIRRTFKEDAMTNAICKHEAAISNLTAFGRTVYDVNPNTCNVTRLQRKRAMENFNSVFNEIHEKLVVPSWEGTSRDGEIADDLVPITALADLAANLEPELAEAEA